MRGPGERKRVLLIGGTGLVGGLLLERAGAHPGLVITSLTRRAGKGVALDFDQMLKTPEASLAAIAPAGADVAISCLGTTIRKAGSEAAMWRIDHDYVEAFARGARAAGARQFILMTSAGAGGRGFYLAMKGAVERAVEALGYPRVDLIRPGLLVGDRAERRPAEQLAQLAAPLMNLLLPGPLARYRALPAETVARAILSLSGATAEGRFLHENASLRRFAGALISN